MSHKRFILVGGNPFRGYNGTTTFTGLRTIGMTDSKEDLKTMVDDHYDECGGLLLVIDLDHENDPNIPFNG
jgi:hypothetical protein